MFPKTTLQKTSAIIQIPGIKYNFLIYVAANRYNQHDAGILFNFLLYNLSLPVQNEAGFPHNDTGHNKEIIPDSYHIKSYILKHLFCKLKGRQNIEC